MMLGEIKFSNFDKNLIFDEKLFEDYRRAVLLKEAILKEQFFLFEFHEFLKKKGMKELPRHFFYRFPEYSEMEIIGLEYGKLIYGTIMPGLEMMFNFLSLIKDEEMVIGEMRAMLDRKARKLDLMLKTP